MQRRRGRIRAVVTSATVAVLAAATMGGVIGPVQAVERGAVDTTLPGVDKLISVQPVNLAAGAKHIGLAAKGIFIQATKEGTVNIRMFTPLPYARIVPVTGDPYEVSAGELTQYFTALLGPNPTLGISYGKGDRQRSLTFTDSVTAPVYDPIGQSISFQAAGSLQPVSSENALVTFVATDPNSRPSLSRDTVIQKIESRAGAFDPATYTHRKLWYRSGGQADSNATYTYDPTSFGSPGAPPTILSPTQKIYGGSSAAVTSTSLTKPSCISYDPNSTSTGGTIISTANMTTQSTSSQVSQSVNAGTSASMKYGGLKTSMAASYTGSTTQDAASVYAVATVVTTGQATTLAPALVKDMSTVRSVSDAVGFIASCGDQAATSYTTGAMYQAVLQMQTTSQASANTLAANLNTSYSTPGSTSSVGGGFSATVANNNTVQNVKVTELCIGPSSCTAVPGYVGIPTTDPSAGVNAIVTNALNAFNTDFTAMTTGLANTCTPSSTSSCVMQLNYSPIENLIPSSSSTAKSYVSQASNGVYWMLTNAQNWANGYQSLATAWSQAATYTTNQIAKYSNNSPGATSPNYSAAQLTTQANSYSATAQSLLAWAGSTCNGVNANSANCSSYMVACANALAAGKTTTDPACLPSSVSGMTTFVDPSLLSGPILLGPAQTCDDPSISHADLDNAQVTLYLGGIQAVDYQAWCYWANGKTTATYIQVTATSKTEAGTTTYKWAQFDPTTGTLYAVNGPYPSNIQSDTKPSCATSCAPAPLGYVEVPSGGVGSNGPYTFSVKLPAKLGFAGTTSHKGSGNSTVTSPQPTGVVSNTWSVSLKDPGTDLLQDKNYLGTGITKIVPLDPKYTFAPTSIAPAGTPAAAGSCALFSSGKTTNSGDASSNNVSNQKLQGVQFVNGVPGACTAMLYETNYKYAGKPTWWDSNWYVTSEWGPLYPTFICGSQTAGKAGGNADMFLTIGTQTSAGLPIGVGWYASTASNATPWMSVQVFFDNVNQPLASTNGKNINVSGQCPYNTSPIDGS